MARPLPAIRGRADPRSDPRFKRVADKLDADGRKLKQHPPAKKKASEPEKAAKGPPDEKAGGARARQVDKLDKAETPKPETQSFLSILQAEIAKAMPKSLGETENFMKGGKSEELKGSLKGNVDQQKQEATGNLKQTSNQTPNEAGIQAKPVTPIPPEAAPPTPGVDAPGAMPAPRPQSEITLEASKEDVAESMKQEKLSDDRLKKANDPRFSAVLTSRDAVTKQADAGPAKYRAAETSTLASAAGKAVGIAKKGVSMLLGVKGGSKKKVLSRQEQQKAKEEQELQTFTTFVKKTFDDTKKSVDDRLAKLETAVNDMFDRGTDAALSTMKKFVEDKLHRYKVDRYLNRIGGSLLWIKDQLLDLPDEVNVFYEQGRQKFEHEMNTLAERVANLVESELAGAKAEVKRAQTTIAVAQKALSPAIQQRAARAAGEYTEKFAELQQGIEDKKQQLAEGLAQKYKEAFDKANEAIKAIQEENKGLVTKAKEAIGEVIKALREFKNRIMGILRKAADTIDLILDDPIGFLSNLLAAIKQGLNQFLGNIWTHLKAGFMKWLFGSLASAGIQLPTDLTLPSILKLVLGVLGITYDRMRAKAVKLIGERAVSAIEKVVEYIQVLIQGGPGALWEKVKEDLSDLKQMVIDAIQDWIVTTIVKKAIAKIASMFNPAGAIIQAILMIVDVVVFVVTKANQILDFVEAVVDSIANIARGAIGAAANWVEKALANMVPILIGFLASLIGLGGITEKIKSIIQKVQAKVDKAIDKAIKKVVDVVKKLFGRGGKKKDEKDEKGDHLQDATYKEPFAMGKEGHTIAAKLEGGKLHMTVASAEEDLISALRSAIATVSKDEKREKTQRDAILGNLRPALSRAESAHEDWVAAEARDPRGGNSTISYEKFMHLRVADIISKLKPLAKYNITDLQHILKKLSKRRIPAAINIRKRLYDDATKGKWKTESKKYRDAGKAVIGAEAHKLWVQRSTNFAAADAGWQKLIAARKIDEQKAPTFATYDHPKDFPKLPYETDHITSLGVSWNAGEKNKDDADRAKTALDKTNWQVLTERENQEKGGVSFARDVGEDFSSNVAASPKGSPTIDGLPFEEA